MGKLSATCDLKGCAKPAHWQVALVLFATGFTKRHQGLRAETGLAICVDCGRTIKPADVIADEGWVKLSAAIQGIGKAPPDRALTRIELLPILLGDA